MIRFIGRKEVAELIGVKAGTLDGYKIPPPDVAIGNVRGWSRETIEEWHKNRPGRGARTDLKK